MAPALERDDSLFVASAWNDNGFAKHGDPGALRRTGWFPGLGWLLPRKLWETELHPQWPDGHWDHWMRSDEVARGREWAAGRWRGATVRCGCPAVCRRQ